MDNSFSSAIESSTSILILLPTRPFFDQVAAGLALYLSLRSKSQEVSISCPSPMLVEFNRLVGVDKIASELGNKNLIIRFIDYKATDIEKVSYDIEGGEFMLTVIPKTGVPVPQKDQAVISYTGVSADTVIMVGGVNSGHFPVLSSKEFKGAKLIHVGKKAYSSDSGNPVMSFARPASSASEAIFSLLSENKFSMDPDIATNLLLGIEDGSKNYSSPEVTAETFQNVADLMRAGGRRVPKTISPRFPAGSVPGEKLPSQGSEKPPKDWLAPKIFKGTTVS